MNYYARSVWELSSYPVTGPASLPDEWAYNTLHWPGGNVNVADPVGVLRNMQASWVRSKGYSLGYNFAVFPDGSVFEIRGFDIRCAANGNQDANRPGIAILLAVPDVYTPPTDAMVQGVRAVIAQNRVLVPQTLTINAHRDVRPEPTQCCGDVICQMIAAGTFEPTQSSDEEEGMIFRTTGTGDKVFAQGSDMSVRHVSAQEGAVAEAGNPSWDDGAPTLSLPGDVVAWLNTL